MSTKVWNKYITYTGKGLQTQTECDSCFFPYGTSIILHIFHAEGKKALAILRTREQFNHFISAAHAHA